MGKKIIWLVLSSLIVAALVLASCVPTTPIEETAGTSTPPPKETTVTPTPPPKEKHGYSCEEDLIEVMFEQDSKVRLHQGALVDMATNALAGVDDILEKLEWFEWYRICDVPEETLDEIQARGEANTGKPVYNLNNIYRLRIPMGLDVWAISEELEALPGVMLARPVPKPMPLPQPPNYVTYIPQSDTQGYLRSANSTPSGIDADYAWTQSGGNGTGVTVYDLEYSWNYNHADITKAFNSQINPNPIVDPFYDDNHGTAVIGELVSDNNSWGTTGICYGASLKTVGTYYIAPYENVARSNIAGAIIYAIADALENQWPPSVILLELEWDYYQRLSSDNSSWIPSDRYVPIEWYETFNPQAQTPNPVYVAIISATSNGIHVVEPGGNGNVNTDNLTWYWEDSQAIIVGAGGAYLEGTYTQGELERLPFSSYGTRFNLQAWGEDVVTTGYGDLYSAEGPDYYYTDTFSGTSSASPIVAGAVAVVEGTRLASGLPTLSPAVMRSLLVTTGTPQRGETSENESIGPRPNLLQALLAPTPIQFRLRISGSAGGGVSVSPNGPWWDPDVPESALLYPPGAVVNLTANPSPGWTFVNWSGNVTTVADVNSVSTNITMYGNYTVTANFVQAFRLTIGGSTGGGVSVSPNGPWWDPDDPDSWLLYPPGTVVNLTANPSPGYVFVTWSGNVTTVASVTSPSTTITMNGNYTVTANFNPG